MMRCFFLLILSVFFTVTVVSAQKDTVYTYYNRLWKPVAKDSAVFYEKKYWHNQLMTVATYRVDSNIIMHAGSFADSAGRIRKGFFARYNRNGVIRDSVYQDGKLEKEGFYFDNDGHKVAYFHMNDSGAYDLQQGWDNKGNEIPDYVAMRPAVFPGGDSAWKAFLIQGISTWQSADYATGNAKRMVEVLFVVDSVGQVTNVRVGKSSGNIQLDKHAVEVIKSSPRWTPGIQFNQFVSYFRRQSLYYTSSR